MSETTQAMPETLQDKAGYIRSLFQSATPAPYSVRLSPGAEDEDGAYYIAGAPGTKVVADGLSLGDALVIVYLLNNGPDIANELDNIARVALAAEPESLLELVKKYQEKIGQLSGDPAPVPAAKTAADLSFLHVGCFLSIGEGGKSDSGVTEAWTFRILNVSAQPSGLIGVTLYPYGERQIILLPDTPVQVLPSWDFEGPQVAKGTKSQDADRV